MAQTERRNPLTKPIILAALCAGTLDIADALVFYGQKGVPPARVLQGISFALLGRKAYSMGEFATLLGLCLHFLIATCVAAVYVIASRKLPLSRHPFLYGGIYGCAVYVVMNYIVLPLSHIGSRPTPPLPALLNGVIALILCVGIPTALITRAFERSGQR